MSKGSTYNISSQQQNQQQQMIYQTHMPNMNAPLQQHLYINEGQTQQMHPQMSQFATAQPFIPGAHYGSSRGPDTMGNYQSGYAIHPSYNMQNAGQTFQYQSGYVPQSTYQQYYVVTPNGYGNVMLQPPLPTNTVQHMSAPRHQIVYNQIPQSQGQPTQVLQPVVQQTESEQPKKRIAIKITDPNTGKDVTNELGKRKEEQTPRSENSIANSALPVQDDHKAKIQATFAAQVAAAASSGPPTESKVGDKKSTGQINKNIKSEDIENRTIHTDTHKKPLDIVDGSTTSKQEETLNPDSAANIKLETIEQATSMLTADKDADIKVEHPDEKATEVTVAPEKDSQPTFELEQVVEDNVAIKLDEFVEAPQPTTSAIDESVTSGTDEPENSGSAPPITKKKKGKNRFKVIDSKDNNDLLSAFTDKPVGEPVKEPEVPKVPEKRPEDETWEEKEKTIEKEIIKGEDAEEPEIIPKTVETKIIKSEGEDMPMAVDDEKLQYDRDFLLRFQFAPICTSKPANLPDIDIVLSNAHAPTKALVPGTRNDFMPTFMRQVSGGRSSSGGKSRSGRNSASSSSRQPKVLHAPAFEKVELKKSENAWVRPSEKAKELSDHQRVMDELERNVRSILNKLTPQKFKTLVENMLQLHIDSVEKLEAAIALIFEKAVSEPGFSVAYANMCRVLTDQFRQPLNKGDTQNDGKAPVATFRKILLNKCQKEFEKESSDEKLLEEDRNKEFSKEEEKKAWKEELDYREMMNRKRMLGNIRFIGELFKLKMISENIMHDCILKLLRAEKQDSLEDQLECLCKLLSTVGKDLDHEKAKPRMDQYFQQINKTIEKKKISSRIKFALQDIIDLRSSNWIPRHDDGNPKTIDQIHKEAQIKEKQEEMVRQQEKLQRTTKGKEKGRDSTVTRSGVSVSADGWTNVSSKAGRQIAPAAVDASKFKVNKKIDSSEISLGPSGKPGAWSRGASGGGSRSGSGANTPTNDLDQKAANRYDVLSESAFNPGSVDSKRRRGAPLRKLSQTASHGQDERNAAVRAVKDMTGGSSSRNESPGYSSPDEVSIDSTSGQETSGEQSISPNLINEEQMRKTTKSILEEYFNSKDIKEVVLRINELRAPQMNVVFVHEATSIVIEKKSEQRRLVGALLHDMVKEKVLHIDEIFQGFSQIIELAQDLAYDVPLIYKYLGDVIGPIVYDGTLSLNRVKDALEPLVEANKAGIVMAEALSVAVQIAGKEESICALWDESSITWDMLLSNSEDAEELLKDKKLEFTIRTRSHSSQILEEMLRLLKENKDSNNKIISFIDLKVTHEDRQSPEFIRTFTKTVCSSTIRESSSSCECNKDLLQQRSPLLSRYINGNKKLELYAVFALQELANDLNHPKDLLQTFFEKLFDNEVISDGAFYSWETSKDFPEGKGSALSSVKGFLKWLHNADEEPNED